VEFCDREELDRDPVKDMRGFGTYDVPAGTWSDDTSMSLAALRALTDEDWNCDSVMNNFVKWIENGEFTATGEAFDVGGTCLRTIKKYVQGNTPARECGGTDERSNGNGSLMRIHPFVLYGSFAMKPHTDEYFPYWMALIGTASALTHAHERSIVGCLIYAFVLMHLLNDPSKSAIELALRRAEIHLREYGELSHYGRIFGPDFANIPQNGIKSSGYVVDTLEAALWCLLTTDTYRDCVLKAVNLGGDTDTIAAIAGGLAGALYGYDAIPGEWLDTLLRRDYIEQLCERAAQNWR
jgi:ADP-ribosylglycohydrolase